MEPEAALSPDVEVRVVSGGGDRAWLAFPDHIPPIAHARWPLSPPRSHAPPPTHTHTTQTIAAYYTGAPLAARLAFAADALRGSPAELAALRVAVDAVKQVR